MPWRALVCTCGDGSWASEAPCIDAAAAAGAVTRRLRRASLDAAAVVAAFNMNVRIADATGIPLDEPARDAREAIAVRLGVQRYEE